MDNELEEIKKEIQFYYNRLEYLYVKANTKSKLRRLLYTLGSIEELCSEELFDFKDVVRINCDDSDYEYDYSKFLSFIDNINANEKNLKDFSMKTINIFRSSNYPFYKKYKTIGYIPFDDIQKLITDFFASFDDDSINSFINNIDNNFYYTFDAETEYSGVLYDLPIFKRYAIHLNTIYGQDLYFAIANAHEMGHAYEKELFYNTSGSYLSDKCIDTFFCEVVSSFFEYAFIKYLKDNRCYDKEIIKHEENTYFVSLFKYAFGTYIASLNSDGIVDYDYTIKLDNKEIMDRIEKLKEKLNYYELPSYDEKISIRNSIIYFIGQLFAMHLYEGYKNAPNEFMKNFRTALVNYPRTNSIDSFGVVGITKEKLLSGKVLKRELEKFIKDK